MRAAAVAGPAVVWRGGVHIVGTVVSCDAPRPRELCFLSSASAASHVVHRQVLTTARTRALVEALAASRARHGLPWREAPLVATCGRPFTLGRLRLELFPSGHLPGAAALVVDAAGRRVAHAGAFNPSPGRRGERCEVRGADVLVAAAPLASLGIPLPPRANVEAALLRAVANARSDGAVTAVLAPSPGAAEEVFALLVASGVPVRAHPRVAALVDEAPAPAPRRKAPPLAPGDVLVWPLDARFSPTLARALAKAPRARRLLVGDPALDAAACARLGCDEAFPLADTADLDGLVAHARATGARELYLTEGFAPSVAAACARAGIACRPLGPPHQLSLFPSR